MTPQSTSGENAGATRALVLGLGASGLSSIAHLKERGLLVRAADTRHASPNADQVRHVYKDVAICEGPFDSRLLEDIDLLVLSPGVSVDDPLVIKARECGIDIVGDVELFARAFNAEQNELDVNTKDEKNTRTHDERSSIIGITGSNGKSTVTALTGEILKAAKKSVTVGGNIGQPVLTLRRLKQAQCFVLELSSFQLETVTTLKLKAATLLNLSEDHLDRHNTLQRYGEAKARIFEHAEVAVVNRDDTFASSFVPSSLPRVSFGSDAPARVSDLGLSVIDGVEMIVIGDQPLMRLSDSPLIGRHNALNIMAAIGLASVFKVDPHIAVEAVKTFSGLPHRMQFVTQHAQVTWINDSKGTNVGSTVAAVKGIHSPIILICGGQAKGQSFEPLMRVAESSVRELIVFGEDIDEIDRAAQTHINSHIDGTLNTVRRVSDLAEAVSCAAAVSRSGDTVLFSPACASFDMFDNFVARGEAFSELVLTQTGQSINSISGTQDS